MKNEIVLKNISVTYEDTNVLSNVSFEVKQGLPTCVIGRGASGKTTLLKSIVGLVNTSKGKIFINQSSANKTDKSMVHNLFGVVFQKDALFDSLRVWQNVMFQSLGNEDNKTLILKSKKILKNVGLSTNDVFLFPNELSGGMRKRVAIARAISHNPKFLILDEPTAGLDPIKSNLIFKIISDLAILNKVTVLAVTSDMKGALKYFKRIVILDNNKIHWKGTSASAKKKPTNLMKDLFCKVQ
ncbi:MAG: ABC transporter ATP-binding protein [Rickettsiales bacterium]|nr:ABC transporter ATP-binding protein [Rickettsiales bacterium]